MSAIAFSPGEGGLGSVPALLRDGFVLMRERFLVYLGFAVVCGVTGVLKPANPLDFSTFPAIRVVLLASLLALYFILPSALRRVRSNFRMTFPRIVLATVMILSVGIITELGYVAVVIPGIAVGVLLSQALMTALLRSKEKAGPGDLLGAMRDGYRASFEVTSRHFMTTLGVIALSLLILGIPFLIMLIAVVVLYVLEPRSLVVTAPLLFFTFIYFECVRYSLMVRWYKRLLPQEVAA